MSHEPDITNLPSCFILDTPRDSEGGSSSSGDAAIPHGLGAPGEVTPGAIISHGNGAHLLNQPVSTSNSTLHGSEVAGGPRDLDSLSRVAIPIIQPVEPGPPDVIPGLLPRRGELVISGETNIGKAMALNTLIPTPKGFRTMEDLNVNDVVFGTHGQPVEIEAISTIIDNADCFKVTFDDQESVIVDGRHQWTVSRLNTQGNKQTTLTTTTADLYKRGVRRTHNTRYNRSVWRIPLAQPLQFIAPSKLPLDPYLFGLWLGDGDCSTGNFTTADPELAQAWREKGWDIRKLTSKYRYGIRGLLVRLRQMGVLNNKHIPSIYLMASKEDRISLLQGLLDTDGWRVGKGSAEFDNMNKRLAEDVAQLATQLGCRVTRTTKEAKLHGKSCGTCYIVRFRASFCPFRLERKGHGWKLNTKLYRTILTITPTPSVPVKCIRVNSPDHLFLCGRNCVPTHNSLVALEICSSLITGRPLWGELYPNARAGKILYVLGEHYTEVIQNLWAKTRLPLTENVLIIGPEKLGADKWLINNGKPNLYAMDKFKRWAEGMDLIVFDPLASFIVGKEGTENDNLQMRLVLDAMSLIAQSTGASCLVLAHQGKPSIGQNGKEIKRTKYATRGASGIEDAATNIFYMGEGSGDSTAAQAASSGGRIIELNCRKYKGEAPDQFRLLRDPSTLTHTLVGNRPFVEVQRIDTQAHFARFALAFPSASQSDIIKMIAVSKNVSERTIYRHLGQTEPSST